MLSRKNIFETDELSAILITAEYTQAYSEADFTPYVAISFPVTSCFNYRIGGHTLLLDSNHVLFEKGNTEFIVSKFDLFDKDVTLSIQFRKPDLELMRFLKRIQSQVILKRRS